jgi:hypothetical protein
MAQTAAWDNSSTTRNTYGCAARDIFLTNIGYVINGEINMKTGNRWSDGPPQWALTADLLMGGGYLSAADQAVVRRYFAVFAYEQVNSLIGSQAVIGNYNSITQFNTSSNASYVGMRAMANNYTQARTLVLVASSLEFNDDPTDDPLMATGAVIGFQQISAAGTGWAIGDQFHIGAGSAVGQIVAEAGGVPTSIEVVTPSTGYANSGSPVSTTAIFPSVGAGLTVEIVASNTCGASRGATLCSDGSGGDLHSYWGYVTGGMLYKYWANIEDPNIVQQAYNTAYSNFSSIPNCGTEWGGSIPCLGSSQGGEPSEGTNYGNSYTSLIRAAIAIQNAGYFNAQTYGPQMSALTSSYMDLRVVADYSFLVGLSGLSTNQSNWAFLTDGDSNTYNTYPAGYTTESAILDYDDFTGRTDRANELEWIVLNSAFGMAAGTVGGCTSSCGFINELGNVYAGPVLTDVFVALPAANPVTTNPPTDPRSSFPTDWYDIGNQHITVRDNGWGTGTGTIFSTYCTNTHIDHEHNFCLGYNVYSNGEYITKGREEFNNYNDSMSLAMYKNVPPSLQYPGQTYYLPPSVYWNQPSFGGQQYHGNQAGVADLLHSDSPAYVAAIADYTNLSNGGGNTAPGHLGYFNQTSSSSRSEIYLRATQQVIAYDRTATGANSWDKSNFFMTTGAPTISGNTVTWLTRSGTQKAAWTTLLPSSGATFSSNKLVTYLSLTAPYSILNSSSTMQATCTATNGDGTTTNVSSSLSWSQSPTWSSDTPSVATVSTSGLITAHAAGSFSLGCNYLGLLVYSSVTVTAGSSSTPTINVTGDLSQLEDWEPYAWLQVDDGNATSAQFLSSLQWGSSSFTPATATLVQSSSGQTFQGALLGSTLVMFMQAWPTSFTGVTYPASGATAQYVSDLSPSTTYSITGAGTPANCTTDSAGVCAFSATGTGNITVGAFIPPAITAVQGIDILGASVQ